MSKNSRVIRDLIRIGVFTALLIAVQFLIACTVGYIPILMLTLMPCVLACVGGIINMIMLSKLKMGGGILISSILFGLCMFNMAPYGFMFFTCLAGGLLGELTYHILGMNTFRGRAAGLCVNGIAGAIGQYAPFIWMKEAYLELYADNSAGTLPVAEYSIAHVTIPFMIIMTILTLGFTVLGCFWGKKIMEKNFRKKL